MGVGRGHGVMGGREEHNVRLVYIRTYDITWDERIYSGWLETF